MKWSVEIIPRNAEGEELYLRSLKPFRLASLQLEPKGLSMLPRLVGSHELKKKERLSKQALTGTYFALLLYGVPHFAAFSSTFAREAAFGDAEWLARLHNPAATTFIARHHNIDPGEAAQSKVLSSLTLVRVVQGEDEVDDTALWKVNAVFTLPNARRRGIAATLLKEAMCWARKSAKAEGRLCAVAVGVYQTNTAAAALYRTVGFSDVGMADGEDMVQLEWKGGLGRAQDNASGL